MKFYRNFLLVVVSMIVLYIVFLIVSDFNVIREKIFDFKTDYLPIILLLAPLSWVIVFFRWHFLLKNSNIIIPKKENFKIYMAGFAMSVTPGKVGELIKSQFLKSKYGVSRKNTLPIIISEYFYHMVGVLVVSIIGVYYFEFSLYIIILTSALIITTLTIISSETFFKKFVNLISKRNFLKKYVSPISDSHIILKKSTRGKIFIISSGLSIAFWLTEVLIVYFVFLSFNILNFEFFKIAAIYTTSLILGMLSFLPMGIGVVEGSLAGFLNYEGIDISIALTLVILIRIFTRWYGVIVGLIFMKLIGGFSKNLFAQDEN
jgi:uncharacterized protein (TIRG00374 family)